MEGDQYMGRHRPMCHGERRRTITSTELRLCKRDCSQQYVCKNDSTRRYPPPNTHMGLHRLHQEKQQPTEWGDNLDPPPCHTNLWFRGLVAMRPRPRSDPLDESIRKTQTLGT